jgi:hypothetical protein
MRDLGDGVTGAADQQEREQGRQRSEAYRERRRRGRVLVSVEVGPAARPRPWSAAEGSLVEPESGILMQVSHADVRLQQRRVHWAGARSGPPYPRAVTR